MDAIRAQLDEFLGKDRNLLPKDRVKVENHFTDDDICKYYLCGLCPNELFTNANIRDLGPCTKLHDDNCVKQYENCKDKDKYDYERHWVYTIENLISDNDKKIKRNKERLLANPNGDTHNHAVIPQQSIASLADNDEEGSLSTALQQPQQAQPENRDTARLKELDEKIQKLLKEAEELGEEGQITEAQNLMTSAEELKTEKAELEKAINEKNENKKMSVCEICGALLFVGDKEKRSISHLEGKKHIGFAKIRSFMDEYYQTNGRRPRESFYGANNGGGSGGPSSGGNYYSRDNYSNNNYNNNSNGGHRGGGNRYRDYDRPSNRDNYGGRDNRDGGNRDRYSRDGGDRDNRGSRYNPYGGDDRRRDNFGRDDRRRY
ncbi:hypothetical protein CYY_000122 [Polysphondylium violaceum]|uniref:Uncharacterized protein n=1 Tax=Polysphondylium violaceum TaxID=133409 RepID=A0A8J4Q4L4_9MYCE|nr:hypothetical protein CYY_000122 [Polysphondylium violaceum]